MPRSTRPARPGALGAAALAALALAGCAPYVQGNGVYGEQDRTPPTRITGVQVKDGLAATITTGAAQKVVVSGDANWLPYLKTQVVTDEPTGPVLHVGIDLDGGSGSSTIPPRVVVQLADLRYVSAAGALTNADVGGVATDLLTIEARDGGNVDVSGAGGLRVAVVAAAATVHAGSYAVSEGALVDVSSGARVELRSGGPVTGTVRGGCTLTNAGSGGCAGVSVPAGETASVCAKP